MQLFLDVDGVLLNFERAFVGWLNRSLGLGLPEDYETESWFFRAILSREKVDAAWLEFMDSEYCGQMEPLVDPGRFNQLTAGHEVHLLTNFPQPFMAKRTQNLAALGFAYSSLHYCGPHPYKETQPRPKAEVVGTLRNDGKPALFVDDHPDNCLEVNRQCPGVEVWVMSRRFNRDFAHPEISRAEGWEPLFERLG